MHEGFRDVTVALTYLLPECQHGAIFLHESLFVPLGINVRVRAAPSRAWRANDGEGYIRGLKFPDRLFISLPSSGLPFAYQESNASMPTFALILTLAGLALAIPQKCSTVTTEVVVPKVTSTYSTTDVSTVQATEPMDQGTFTWVSTISSTNVLMTLTSTSTACGASGTV